MNEVVIIGAGPYGLSVAAHLTAAGLAPRVFGKPMETWRAAAPAGMWMKSEGFATSLSDPAGGASLGAFCRAQGRPYADIGAPVPVETFADYGEAFARQTAPQLEPVDVTRVARRGAGFLVTLADGRTLEAARVIVATGIRPFATMPAELAHLPPALASHSSARSAMDAFKGKRVAVIGAGASALDVAASLHEAGAHAVLVTRRKTIRFFPPSPKRTWLDALRAPMTPLGPGWKKWACVTAPRVFAMLPEELRLRIVRRTLGPAPTWHVRDRVTAVEFIYGAAIERAEAEAQGVALTLREADGAVRTLGVDHVIAATGYRIDVARLGFLDAAIVRELDCVDAIPRLDDRFQSSIPGLFFVGALAAPRFGPMLRFICGAPFAARRLTRVLRALPPQPASTQHRAGPPRLLFVDLSNDAGSSRILAACGAQGAACAVLGPADGYASASRFAARTFALPTRFGPFATRLRLRASLEAAVRAWGPERIIALDELAAGVLRRLVGDTRTSVRLRALLIASFGAPHHYDTALDRGALLRLAAERGVETPQFCALRGGRDAAAAHQLGFPLVLKREGTCGGAGIVMVTRADDFASAYGRLARKARLKRAALMLTGQAVGAGPPLIAQAFAPGVLGMTAIACANGAVLESASFLSERQDPPGVGASTIVRPVEHPAMEAAAATLAGALRCSGFVSFDFICSPDGGASLIEMNARPIALTHLGAWSGRDVAAAYLRALTGLPPAARTEATVLEPIALFPRDLVRDPAGSEATGARLDVNWDDPPVLAKHAAALVRRHPAARERLLARLAAATAIAAE